VKFIIARKKSEKAVKLEVLVKSVEESEKVSYAGLFNKDIG
jgi:hypothetical protein